MEVIPKVTDPSFGTWTTEIYYEIQFLAPRLYNGKPYEDWSCPNVDYKKRWNLLQPGFNGRDARYTTAEEAWANIKAQDNYDFIHHGFEDREIWRVVRRTIIEQIVPEIK